DVDRDNCACLEEEMFEISMRTGKSGHYQWGLELGDRQGMWEPYFGIPEH
ncbi:hypothetical protein BDZ94DRAFT_1170152, partial [Collybia nuda]